MKIRIGDTKSLVLKRFYNLKYINYIAYKALQIIFNLFLQEFLNLKYKNR